MKKGQRIAVKKKEKLIEEKDIIGKKEIEKKQNKQIKMVLVAIAFIIGIFIGAFFIGNELRKFDFSGMEFEKIKQGELTLFHTVIPIKDFNGNLIANYNLFLRYDPRQISIPINGIISLQRDMIIAADPKLDACEEKFFGVTLVRFLKEAASRNIEIATTDKNVSNETGLMYADCSLADNKTIVLMKEEKMTQIYQNETQCYVIAVSNCEIGKAIERFIVGTIAHSRGRKI